MEADSLLPRLDQRVAFTRRSFVTEHDGVRLIFKTPLGSSSELVSYWQFGPNLSEATNRWSGWWLAGAGLMAIMAFAGGEEGPHPWLGFTILVGSAIGLLVIWLLMRQRWKGYPPMMLLSSRPSSNEVDAFLQGFDQRRALMVGLRPAGWAEGSEIEHLDRLHESGWLTSDEHQRWAEALGRDGPEPGGYV